MERELFWTHVENIQW